MQTVSLSEHEEREEYGGQEGSRHMQTWKTHTNSQNACIEFTTCVLQMPKQMQSHKTHASISQ